MNPRYRSRRDRLHCCDSYLINSDFVMRKVETEHEWLVVAKLRGERSKKSSPHAGHLLLRCGEWSKLPYFSSRSSLSLAQRTREIYDRVENKKQTKFCFMIINLSHSTSILEFRCSTEISSHGPFNFWPCRSELSSHEAKNFTRPSFRIVCHEMISNE